MRIFNLKKIKPFDVIVLFSGERILMYDVHKTFINTDINDLILDIKWILRKNCIIAKRKTYKHSLLFVENWHKSSNSKYYKKKVN